MRPNKKAGYVTMVTSTAESPTQSIKHTAVEKYFELYCLCISMRTSSTWNSRSSRSTIATSAIAPTPAMPKAGALLPALLLPVHSEGATSNEAPRRARACVGAAAAAAWPRRDDDDVAWAWWREKASSFVALRRRVATNLAILLAGTMAGCVMCALMCELVVVVVLVVSAQSRKTSQAERGGREGGGSRGWSCSKRQTSSSCFVRIHLHDNASNT